MSVRSIVFVKSALFFGSALRSIRPASSRAPGSAAVGLLYSDAAFAYAVMGTKGGTLD
jgi:hypothetical protein